MAATIPEVQIIDIETSSSVPVVDISYGDSNIFEISTASSSFDTDIEVSTYSTSYYNLSHKPQINGVELIDNKTSEELGLQEKLINGINIKTINGESILGSGDMEIETPIDNFFFNQSVASDTWIINHDLNKYPSVTVLDSANTEVEGEVIYNGLNQVIIKFAGEFKGSATLN